MAHDWRVFASTPAQHFWITNGAHPIRAPHVSHFGFSRELVFSDRWTRNVQIQAWKALLRETHWSRIPKDVVLREICPKIYSERASFSEPCAPKFWIRLLIAQDLEPQSNSLDAAYSNCPFRYQQVSDTVPRRPLDVTIASLIPRRPYNGVPEELEAQFSTILRLYIDEGRTVESVMEVLEQDYDLRTTWAAFPLLFLCWYDFILWFYVRHVIGGLLKV